MLAELSMEEVNESTASCQSLPTSGREAALRLSSSCSLARLLVLVVPSSPGPRPCASECPPDNWWTPLWDTM